MNFKIKLKKLINQIFDATENLIYSVKYLPQILYFGSLGIILYSMYSWIFREVDIIPGLLELLLIFFFIYMSHLIAKNNKKNKS